MGKPAEQLREAFFDSVEDPTLLERLFSSVPDIVFCIKDRAGKYISANDAFAQRLGLGSRWEIVGRTALDLFPDSLAQHYQSQDAEVFAGGEGFRDRMELIPCRVTGIGWYLATKVPMRGRMGKVVGLASISRDLKVPSGQEMGYAGLAKVVAKIEGSFGEKLERGQLASLASLSEPQLERRVKKVFGLSVAGFVRKVRIENGARMLTESDAPLVEVAAACGYSEQSAFTRQFKATVGMPPGVYRKEFAGWWSA
jgi:PAS domain S-box-containing protein